MMKQPASLYGLGIPPAQYKALAADSPKGIGDVLSQRVERLACGLRHRRQLLRLAGVRPPLCAGAEPVAAALSAEGEFRGRAQPRGPGALRPALVHRDSARFAGSELRPLRAARRAGLDERCRPHGAVDGNHPHRATGRARHLPHRRRRSVCCPAACPTSSSAAGPTTKSGAASSAAQDRSSIYGAFHLYTLKDA